MRTLLTVVIAAALIWSGFWVVSAQRREAGLADWIEARRAEGWVADYADLDVRGFPNRLDTTFTDLALADPETGLAWQMPQFQILALIYKRDHLIAAWPSEQRLATPRQKIDVTSDRLRGSFVFVPDTDWRLDRTSIVGEGLRLESDAGWGMTAERALLASRPAPGLENGRALGAEATSLRLSADLMQLIEAAGVLPEVIDRITIDAEIDYDAPWDRQAIEDRRPQITTITLKRAEARWADLAFDAAGSVSVDAEGRASGEIALRAENWREMLRLAVAAGSLPQGVADQLEIALRLLAGLSGRDDTLDATLVLRDGRMRLGPVPLGEAPRLRLR
ncbi:hypothetical protein Ga0609869_001712 [Rhodovulum iodosum]|uniref:DUF2125 domain-containing protein n=1 Tax=Rhodovulum iodosum TaxID=68291 RepID=A0ABV3XTF6_9RHOB|nr:DUF2125 domain-containing protein [Rhodovulum robiginosum]RSK30675.1 DUF2125 domain-containing protein [Rhodovulum robiginosum]